MKNLKRVWSLLLTLTLALSLCVPTFAASYSDVNDGVWYTDAINYVTENDLMDPLSADRFSPDTDATRAALAVALYRAAGSPQVGNHTFNDIPANSSYSNAAAWAQANGVIAGYDNGGFGGEDFITREQIVAILWRYAGSPTPGASQDFTDEASISAYAAQAVDWSRENGVVNGYTDGRFGPQDHTTRAQLAVILRGYLTRSQPATPEQPSRDSKVLVAYFSATGNTESIAEKIAASLDNADLYEIIPDQPYTDADLNYNTDCRANREQNDDSARPAISGTVNNMSDYDVVFLGYPIWWGRSPKIIYTFLESYDFNGKTVIPFCTSGSSGYNDSGIRNLVDNGTTWVVGQRFSGDALQSAVENWVNNLNLAK